MVTIEDINKIAVVGAGSMGAKIVVIILNFWKRGDRNAR